MKKYISYKNLPPNVPLSFYVLYYLLLEHLQANENWYYVLYVLTAFFTLNFLYKITYYKNTNVFKYVKNKITNNNLFLNKLSTNEDAPF